MVALRQVQLEVMAKAKDTKKEAASPKTIQNRRARFDYHILDEVEAGLVLVGSEVKSILAGLANLTDAYVKVVNGEMWLVNADVDPYMKATSYQPERRRERKLLLHKREILVFDRKMMEKGLTIIPLEMYFKNGRVKVRIGLGQGKAMYDKRDSIAKNDTRREMERARSGRY